jgi:5-(carboxyamino)imidazole ribonucleotide mutase
VSNTFISEYKVVVGDIEIDMTVGEKVWLDKLFPVFPHKTVEKLEIEGYDVIIAGAGLAAHLPGVIASKTTLPVIGVPIEAAFNGMDALLSIVQMPKSIPVATVGVNNSYNAGMLAVQMLSLKSPELKEKLRNFRKDMKAKFIADNESGVEL